MKKIQVMLSLLALMVALLIGAAMFGTVDISIRDFFKVLASQLPGQMMDGSIPKSTYTIILKLRLPRVVLALFSGIGLAYSGVVYQAVFKNPMAEPYLLGVASGASLGATLGTVLGVQFLAFGFSTVSLFAFAGALSVVLVIMTIADRQGDMQIGTLLLAGLAINYFISAFVSVLMLLNQDHIQEVYFWTMGSFRNASWQKDFIVGGVVLIGILLTYPLAKTMDILLLGDDHAKSLGIQVTSVKRYLLIVTSLMAAVIVASAGLIGFVGLIIPHTMRLLSGPSHKRLLPYSIFAGGSFMMVADTLTRSILTNKEISIGIITSLFGVPFFLWLLLKNKKGVHL